MEIKLAHSSSYPHKTSAAKAIELVNYAQSVFFLAPLQTAKSVLPRSAAGKHLIDFRESADRVRAKFPGQRVVYLTDDAFDNNWFSDTRHDVSIVSTSGWAENFAPPSMTAFIAREVALSALCFSANLTDNDIDNLSREPSVGCVFDFCGDKAEVRFGLTAGYIHPETEANLRRYGINQDALNAVARILDLIRLESIGKPKQIDAAEAFVVMKFTKNDENAAAYAQGIKPALEAFGLAPKRADEDPRMQILSKKVMEHIDQSRLIVIKVDNPNLNVFFELGYAVGREKEILLICDEGQFSAVPSDLKGWELLTYPVRDYETLRTRVSAYLENMLPHRRA